MLAERLDLRPPRMEDLDALHALYSDPAVWTHLPSGRHEQVDVTLAQLARVLAGWSADGLRLICRALDADNPDPNAVRLGSADRELTPLQGAAALK
ncbi:MAG TPA: hypothetical protein DEH05_03755, partial [Propionibacteriaceae bacterium]|nr:hypothetical protein [Propionibacteriaceae bacterium]